jgi:hypothetical protein
MAYGCQILKKKQKKKQTQTQTHTHRIPLLIIRGPQRRRGQDLVSLAQLLEPRLVVIAVRAVGAAVGMHEEGLLILVFFCFKKKWGWLLVLFCLI